MKNEGTADRVVRIILGLGLLAAAWFALGLGDASPLGIVAALVGLVLLVTGAVGTCPAYMLVGMRTCPAPK